MLCIAVGHRRRSGSCPLVLPACIAESNVYSANVLFLDITSVSDEPPKVAQCGAFPVSICADTAHYNELCFRGTDTLFDDVEVVPPVTLCTAQYSKRCVTPLKSVSDVVPCWNRGV